MPFGSLQVNAFDEAEPFYLQKAGPDLYSVAEACDQVRRSEERMRRAGNGRITGVTMSLSDVRRVK